MTVVILWFAGASAMAGLLNLVPQYLPRYGMAPEWARAIRPLVMLFTLINLVGHLDLRRQRQGPGGRLRDRRARPDHQRVCGHGHRPVASAGGRPWFRRVPWGYGLITAAFVYTTGDVVIGKPAGIKIAGFFIAAILVTSLVSRVVRARELRFAGFHFPDAKARLMWDTIRHLGLSVLVPHRPGRRSLASKEKTIREEHRIPPDVMVVFVEVELADPSDFAPTPELAVIEEEGRYVVKVTERGVDRPHAGGRGPGDEQGGKPPTIHFGWTDESPVSGTLGFLLFGEGNVPWEVRELIRKAEPEPGKRPKVMIADA